VNAKLNTYEKQTNDRIAWINNKEQSDMAQMNARVNATDQKVSDVASSVQEAQGTASRAMEEASAAKSAAAEGSANREAVAPTALNYQLVQKADVMFGFNKANLTSAAKATLNDIASKCQAMPSCVVELAGFTDRTGSMNYNLSLSRRRAWAAERYLVEHKVPLRSIHVIGLGEEAPPEGYSSNLEAGTMQPARGERDALARRVNIQLFGAGDTGAASRSEQ
jgi:OOP family OmpA-OmpF porin